VSDECSGQFAPGVRALTSGEAEIFHFTVTPWAEGMKVEVNP
jgi:hypothetical protein